MREVAGRGCVKLLHFVVVLARSGRIGRYRVQRGEEVRSRDSCLDPVIDGVDV